MITGESTFSCSSDISTYGTHGRYDYTDLCTDVTKFPRPRFASEFGFQSYPSFETIKAISTPQVYIYNGSLLSSWLP